MTGLLHSLVTMRVAGLLGLTLVAAACGEDRGAPAAAGTPMLTAATLGEQTVKTAAEYLEDPQYATASADLGQRLLMQCRACHTLEKDGGHRLGPNLHGIFGREAGTVEGFGYTAALREARFVWTPRALDAWLARPQQFLPGNAMAYAGLTDPQDRAALIAALIRATSAAETGTQELSVDD